MGLGSFCIFWGGAYRPLPWGLNTGGAGLRRAFYLMGVGGSPMDRDLRFAGTFGLPPGWFIVPGLSPTKSGG